jgi:lipopolysaccharide biosynthesis regulator YciM
MEILLPLVFLMGLVLGWMLGLDSGKKMGQESATRLEKAYWLGTVQKLESQIQREQAKVKVLKSDLAWEKLQRMTPGLAQKKDHKK